MKWILKDTGKGTSTEFTSFPYAFRTMFNIVKKAVEGKERSYADVTKSLFIISPQLDRLGKPRVYGYSEATSMATSSGLLTPDGTINSREFRRS